MLYSSPQLGWEKHSLALYSLGGRGWWRVEEGVRCLKWGNTHEVRHGGYSSRHFHSKEIVPTSHNLSVEVTMSPRKLRRGKKERERERGVMRMREGEKERGCGQVDVEGEREREAKMERERGKDGEREREREREGGREREKEKRSSFSGWPAAKACSLSTQHQQAPLTNCCALIK